MHSKGERHDVCFLHPCRRTLREGGSFSGNLTASLEIKCSFASQNDESRWRSLPSAVPRMHAEQNAGVLCIQVGSRRTIGCTAGVGHRRRKLWRRRSVFNHVASGTDPSRCLPGAWCPPTTPCHEIATTCTAECVIFTANQWEYLKERRACREELLRAKLFRPISSRENKRR